MAKGRVVLHYDIKKQRRYISVDDGTMDPIPPSKKEMKSRLADMVDAEKYLRMDSADRLEYVGELIEVLAKEEEDRKKEAAVRRVTQHGKRKLGLVDLTML
ncbi:hypothetical protein HK104_004477 [Borealophlyctis nickersoniae]|nr:hypothetical protein HK104_004477 [Borealophlyctis nickersoniae]